MKIGKYNFNDKAQVDSKIQSLGEEHNHTIVHLGNIVLEQAEFDEEGEMISEPVLSDKYHVDVMWTGLEDHPYGWKSYSVDLDGNGMHSFLGVDYIKNKI